jgi:acyl-CoA dehydrogenase
MESNDPVDPHLVEVMHAVFASYREQNEPTLSTVRRDRSFWDRLNGLGLVRLTGAEESGGSGAGWREAAELARAAAWHGVHTGIEEHDLLACWLLEATGLPVDAAPRTVCVVDCGGTARGVPWAADSDKIVIAWAGPDEYLVADLSRTDCNVTAGANVAGEPRDTVRVDIDSLSGTATTATVVCSLMLRGALIRAVQLSAVLDRIVELAVFHTTERQQFGRPLAKFQSVQNLVADMAAEASLARAATEAAVAEAVTSDWSSKKLKFMVAVARSCAGHAASVVVRNAHQVHGAIGTTHEHRLHEFTKPALAWRSEFGSMRYWDQHLTSAAVDAGRTGLWTLIAR